MSEVKPAPDTNACDACETEVTQPQSCPDCGRCHVCCRCGQGEG